MNHPRPTPTQSDRDRARRALAEANWKVTRENFPQLPRRLQVAVAGWVALVGGESMRELGRKMRGDRELLIAALGEERVVMRGAPGRYELRTANGGRVLYKLDRQVRGMQVDHAEGLEYEDMRMVTFRSRMPQS